MKATKYIVANVFIFMSLFVINVILYGKISNTLYFIILGLSLVIVGAIGYSIISEKRRTEQAVSGVTYFVNKFGKDLFTNIPIGILAVNSSGIIMWNNKYFEELFDEDLTMRSIDDYFPDILKDIEEKENVNIIIGNQSFQVQKRDEALYFFNDTKAYNTEKKFMSNRLVIGVVNIDNYEDYNNSLDEQLSNEVTSHMSSIINEWCSEYNIYIKKYSSARYMLIMNEESLKMIIEDKFSVLDKVRDYGIKSKLPLTLSMSFSHEVLDVNDLAEIAFDGLDLVLGRGGDQVIVKNATGKAEFYGGKTDAIEKRNRSKARMFSSSIANLIRNSENIVVMGHKNADFDSIGGCVGISKLALALNPNVTVVLDSDNLNYSSKKLVDELKETDFYKLVKSGPHALEEITRKTLVIVVDTHRTSLVECPKILDEARNVVVIDHHRRGEEFIENPIISYVEPYASSTSELVIELIDYQIEKVNISPIEATAMLAGIIVDTKHFVYRTGNRTFDAAATLKSLGADTIVIQDLLKEEMDKVVIKNRMISRIEKIGCCALTYVEDNVYVPQEILAQTADEILTIEGIKASFVVGSIDNNTSSLSARSLGDVNVQMFAERFGGGGHMTAAAAQADETSLNEFVYEIRSEIERMCEDESYFS